jgi:benzodiazapine receptor
MSHHDEPRAARAGKLGQAAAWVSNAACNAAAQGLSAWIAQREPGRDTRSQYEAFQRPSFAPPGVAFPVAWSLLNVTTATSAWRVWQARDAQSRHTEALAWWASAVVVRSGYVPLAFGQRRLWAATADAALLCAVMARYAAVACRVDRPAALLALPEMAWTAFATALSAAVALGNDRDRS